MRIGDLDLLRLQLEGQGWEVTAPDLDAPDLDWPDSGAPDLGPWGAAAWRLRSARSPVGLEAELRFIGDSAHLAHSGPPGARGAAPDPRPETWPLPALELRAGGADPLELPLVGRGAWAACRAELVAALARLRDAAAR